MEGKERREGKGRADRRRVGTFRDLFEGSKFVTLVERYSKYGVEAQRVWLREASLASRSH